MIQYTHIYRFFTMLFLAAMVLSCSSGDDVPAANTQQNNNNNNSGNNGNGGSGGSGGSGSGTIDDPDGDGVDTSVEVGENTDPQDPCSYILTSQDYSITTQTWRELDCDGDGVTNGDEVDPDGNNQNNSNGTDPLDQCSLNYLLQTLEPSEEWQGLNCDEDCFLNGTETDMGTNPTNPNLANIGPYLSRIYRFRDFEGYSLFENNGSRYAGYRTNAFGAVYSYYDYIDDKLERVQFVESDQGTLYEVDFSYNGDQISSFNDNYLLHTVEYTNNTITATGSQPYTPLNLFSAKIELDPTTEKVIRCEKYFWDYGSNYDYLVYNYRYDSESENMIESDVEISRYDSDTGEYEFVESYTQVFDYYENILNPVKEASEKLLIPALLVDRYDEQYSWWNISYSFFDKIEATMTSTNLIKSATNSSYFSGIYLTDLCSETDGRPRILYESPNYFGMIFNYSN